MLTLPSLTAPWQRWRLVQAVRYPWGDRHYAGRMAASAAIRGGHPSSCGSTGTGAAQSACAGGAHSRTRTRTRTRTRASARGGRRSGRRSYPGCGTGQCRVVYSSRGRTDHARREEEKVAGPSPASH